MTQEPEQQQATPGQDSVPPSSPAQQIAESLAQEIKIAQAATDLSGVRPEFQLQAFRQTLEHRLQFWTSVLLMREQVSMFGAPASPQIVRGVGPMPKLRQ